MSTARILIVDDEPDSLAAMKLSLEFLEYDVVTAVHGLGACMFFPTVGRT
jgi:CheY-like chemotaxis protein